MKKEIHILNDINQLTHVEEEITQFSIQLGLAEKLCMNIKLALEEAVTNIILYAYPGEKNKDIFIQLELMECLLKIIITDFGQPFDPTQKDKPDLTLPLEQRPIGGLGIHLVREIMSDVKYTRQGDKNILMMVKNIC